MNLLLLEKDETLIGGRRAKHVLEVLLAKVGDSVRAGVIGGDVGSALIEGFHDGELRVRFSAEAPPPAPLDVRVFLALPRPKALRRILATAASLGVKEIHLINAFRVEKAYWHSEHLSEAAIRRACLLGLEQARDTVLPKVYLERRLKPFAEDRLPALLEGRRALLAHPGGEGEIPRGLPSAIVIGPEGGFIPYEVEMLTRAGCAHVSLGERILKCETALTWLLGRLA